MGCDIYLRGKRRDEDGKKMSHELRISLRSGCWVGGFLYVCIYVCVCVNMVYDISNQ